MVINEKNSSLGLSAINSCLLSHHKNTVKFGLGSLLNYTQIFQKSKNVTSPIRVIGSQGGFRHIMEAVSKALEVNDYEALLYATKLIVNLSSSPELIFVFAEAGYLDYLCRICTSLKEGPKHGQTDQKLKKYSKLII